MNTQLNFYLILTNTNPLNYVFTFTKNHQPNVYEQKVTTPLIVVHVHHRNNIPKIVHIVLIADDIMTYQSILFEINEKMKREVTERWIDCNIEVK